MSTTTEYTQALKSIKDAEEESSKEIAEKKRKIAEELQVVQGEYEKSILAAKTEAESYISQETEKAKGAAEAEAEKLLASAAKEAKGIAARRLDKKVFKKIIDEILLAEFKVE